MCLKRMEESFPANTAGYIEVPKLIVDVSASAQDSQTEFDPIFV
jgi:hypothetical protein